MEFVFGGGKDCENPHSKSIIIEAKNIDFAIKKFICSVETLEAYTNENVYTGKDFYLNGVYKYEVDKKVMTSATIPIFQNNKLIKIISVSEIMGMSFEKSNDMDIIPAGTPLPTLYSEYKTVRDNIQERMIEIEIEKKKLNEEVEKLNKFLKSKLNVLKAMETYLGEDEDIIQLQSGKTSDEVLHIYQQKLYMDEEYGIINSTLPDIEKTIEFDYENVELFDKFLINHIDEFIPCQKGIRAFQIKRYDKEYSDMYDNMIKNQYNRISYFYIRNGENIYRVFAQLYIPDSVFPTPSDVEHIYFDIWGSSKHKRSEEDANKAGLPWKYLSAYLQGLIERTSILGIDLHNHVNFMLNVIPPQYVIMVRDMERTDLIEDKLHPSFNDFIKQLNLKSEVGDEIVITENMYVYDSEKYYFYQRHGVSWNRKYITMPSTNVKYKIEKVCDEPPNNDMFGCYKYIKILYFETSEVYGYYDIHDRKKRTAFYLSEDEYINLTKITEDDIIFYLKDRRNRQNYLNFIPKLQVALFMKRNNVQVGNKGKERG